LSRFAEIWLFSRVRFDRSVKAVMLWLRPRFSSFSFCFHFPCSLLIAPSPAPVAVDAVSTKIALLLFPGLAVANQKGLKRPL
jgi:hypothetical protein